MSRCHGPNLSSKHEICQFHPITLANPNNHKTVYHESIARQKPQPKAHLAKLSCQPQVDQAQAEEAKETWIFLDKNNRSRTLKSWTPHQDTYKIYGIYMYIRIYKRSKL